MNDTEHRWRKCLCICLLALFIGLIGIVLPEVETGAITYINASNVSQVGLASFSCSVANISDINHLNCTGNEGTTPWYIDVNFTNVTNFSYTESKLKYFSTVGQSTHINDIEIFCETEGEFIDLITFTNEEDWFYFTRNFPDSMHFIRSDGNVTIRYNHTENGNTNHVIILDTVRLIIKPAFEQNIINLNQTIGGEGTGSQNLSQVLDRGNQAIDQRINFTNTGKWLQVGYNNQTGLEEVNTSSIFYYKQGSTFLGFTGSGYAYSAYNDKPMKFGQSGTNYSQISYNSTYGTTWLGADTGGANGNLNITGFDSVNMYQNLNLTGRLNMTSDNWPVRVSLMDGNGIFTAYNQSIIRTQLSSTGVQEWKLKNATHETGFILYTAPGSPGSVGIIYRNATQGQRTQISLRPYESGGGLELYSSNTSGGATNLTRILDQRDGGTVQIDALAGTGNAYVCVDSTGKLYRGNPGC